jgi:hypothetical protein
VREFYVIIAVVGWIWTVIVLAALLIARLRRRTS